MYCTRCGVELQERDYYCYKCGAATGRAPVPAPPEPLYRSVTDRKIAGVCAGFARYVQMDPTVMRLLWLLLTFGLPPAGILGYFAAWIIVPPEPIIVSRPTPAEPAAAPNGL